MAEQQLTKKEQKKLRKEEKANEREAEARRKQLTKIAVVGVIALAIVALIAGIFMTRESASEITDQTADPTRGPEDSPVTVRVYEDFECPACAAFHPVVKSLVDEYGDRVRFVFNDFPLPQHRNATIAAVGAQCALGQDPEKYFTLADMMFTRQSEWAGKSNSRASEVIRGYAEEAGLDMTAFDSCVTTQPPADAVKEDIEEGRRLGVNATPSFFVNDKRITEQPLSASLKSEIDAALAAHQ